MKPFIFLFFFLNSFFLIIAQDADQMVSKRIYQTNPILNNEVPKIDGVIDDTSWDVVNWAGEFIEQIPDENTSPSQPTKFKIIYDQQYLYVAFRCFDTIPSAIEKRLSRRDGFVGDRIAVMLDTYHDQRTAMSFTITAAGVKGDEFISENGDNWDESWNPIWYVATQIDDLGWTAELKIPLSQLKFGNDKEQIWGLQINRLIFRKDERSLWQRIPRDAPGYVSEFGELHGLKNIKPQKQLEIQPFVVSKLDTYPKEEGNPFKDGSDYGVTTGIDAKIGITNDLTLDLTVNPDFGQVEADPAAIALDGFQVFFREQRPFFVENKNIFDYQFANGSDNLFYSRRIGRNPQGSVGENPITGSSPITDEFVDSPSNTTILGAAKFSGKTKDGWSLGFLETVTSREVAHIEDEDGHRREAVVEPLTNYMVGRVQKDFNHRNSYIGGIFTATNRNLGDILNVDYDNTATDETLELANTRENNLNLLHTSAYTSGLDFRHSWKNRNYFFEGNFVSSYVHGSKEAIQETQEQITHLFQREDASHVSIDPNRTSLSGTGGKLTAGKSGGGNWRYDAGLYWRSPELELNDVGFLRQADEIRQFSRIRYRALKPTKHYRTASLELNQMSSYDFEGNYNRMEYNLAGSMNFINNWSINTDLIHKPRIYTNTMLRGGPRWRFSRENAGVIFLSSDRRKKFSFVLGYVNSIAKQNNFSYQRYEMQLRYQPFNSFSMSLDPVFEENPSKTQYITQKDFGNTTRYITGQIDQQTLSASLRLNYTINPNLTIQYYAQPFVSKGTYSNFNYVANPTADDLNERYTIYDQNQISFADDDYAIDEDNDGTKDYSFSNPDFSFVQFRSNLVLRWEYIPGSEIFLVWSQGVTGNGDVTNGLFRNLDNQILDQQPDNTFLIKATYRFVL